MEEKSKLVEHAERELEFLNDGEPMNQRMRQHLLHMVTEFSKEGHSGFSAHYAISLLEKLLRYEPVRPLTGEDDEWDPVGDGGMQNRRCHHVFKDENGTAFDSESVVFVRPDGSSYIGPGSRQSISFPYVPTRRYVRVDDEGQVLDAYE